MIQQMPESLFMPIQIKCLNELAMFFFFFNTEIHEDFIKNYFKSIHISVNWGHAHISK